MGFRRLCRRSTSPPRGRRSANLTWPTRRSRFAWKSVTRFCSTSDCRLNLVKQRLLEALTDFSYDRLTFDFEEAPADGGLMKVNTHGKGRQGAKPQELDLTLNIRGVNDSVKYALRGKQKYDQL